MRSDRSPAAQWPFWAGLVLTVGVAALVPSRFSADAAFKFTKVDLRLLEKANQFDDYIQAKGLVLAEPESVVYLTAVSRAVLPEGELPENVAWHFQILRDPTPNAFALPNGSIYIHTGLLALLENEAQLAAVLAHEVTHVLDRHGYRAHRSYRKKAVVANMAAVAGSVAGSIGGAAGAVVSVIASVIPTVLEATIYGYSRRLERDADLRAVAALGRVGYPAEEMINTFRLLQKSPEVDLTELFYTDHPKLEARIRYVSESIRANPPTVSPLVTGVERYARSIERVAQHNIGLDLLAGRARSALATSQRLVRFNSGNSDNWYYLGESLRVLGPRTPQPQPDELSPRGKKRARKMLQKMTSQEYEKALWAQPNARERWEANCKAAEPAYRKALELDSTNAKVHRGLGWLYEQEGAATRAIQEFRQYLEAAPTPLDRGQIQRHIEALEKKMANPISPPAPN